jgi:crossover junction endodeoxyribonuclease RuvC
MIVIGIDPGITGALAALDRNGECVYVGDLPITQSGALKWVNGGRLLEMLFKARSGKQPARVFVEYSHAFPLNREGDTADNGAARGNNLNAASRKGMVLGAILATLDIAQLPYELVMPAKWKRALGLIMPKASYLDRKRASLDRARMMFPNAPLDRQRDNGRAEAMLIAHYGQRYVLGNGASAIATALAGELNFTSTETGR